MKGEWRGARDCRDLSRIVRSVCYIFGGSTSRECCNSIGLKVVRFRISGLLTNDIAAFLTFSEVEPPKKLVICM